MKTIHFGIIGLGLMGREFASASARWCHLLGVEARPEIVAVSNRSPAPFEWFRQHFPAVRQYAHDYRELLANPAVEAVYVAVPHHLHEEVCCAALEAGKHLMAEKPVGIDMAANRAITDCAGRHPELFVRCASQWIFYPAAQRIGEHLEHGSVGRVIEVNAGFQHSSDLDPDKPINWKRMIEFNGEYGVMGDLGMHVCALPFVPVGFPAMCGPSCRTSSRNDPTAKGPTCRVGPGTTPRCCVRPPIPEAASRSR